jgi:hypothetical protein
VAGVLGCEVPRVKALVFRARSGLIARREARDTPCEIVREQLANLRGGSLRRTELRMHLRDCAGCRAYREQVRQQRQMLAAALPVAPTLGLKSSVLAAVGLGGGTAGGLTAASGGAALGGVFGSATLAKVAVVGVLAGGVVAGEAVVDSGDPVRPAAAPGAPGGGAGGAASPGDAAGTAPGAEIRRPPGVGLLVDPDGHKTRSGKRADGKAAPGRTKAERGRHRGLEQGRRRGDEREAAGDTGQGRGRGPIEAPPAQTPVRRGPPPKPEPRTSPPPQTQRGGQPQTQAAPERDATTHHAAPAPPAAPPAELEIPEAPQLNGKANSGR